MPTCRPLLAAHADRFRYVSIAFSLFERAWTLRGMEQLLMDMLEAPEFVDELLDAITAFDLGILEEVLSLDIDGVMFGDDWGQQSGLIFGRRLWQRFIKPRIAQLYGAVKRAGKAVLIHCCGQVQELFPELIEAGLDVFNPVSARRDGSLPDQAPVRLAPGVLGRRKRAETPSLRDAAADSRRGPALMDSVGAEGVSSSGRRTTCRETYRWRTWWPLWRPCVTDELSSRAAVEAIPIAEAGSISRGNKSSSSSGGKSATAPNRTIVNTAKHVPVTVIAWAFPLRGILSPYSLITLAQLFRSCRVGSQRANAQFGDGQHDSLDGLRGPIDCDPPDLLSTGFSLRRIVVSAADRRADQCRW